MPYYPISGNPIQYQKANGGLASNYYLKFYASGTSTAIDAAPNKTATDDTTGVPLVLDKVKLDTKGYPVNPSGGVIVPHLDQEYKIVLYKNAADADADNTSAADWVVDGLAPGLIAFTATSGANDASNINYLADPTATTRTVQNKLQEFISVKDFGATGDGSTDDSTAFSTALLSGLNVIVPAGTYLIGGIICQTDYQSVHFQSGVTLKANANNVVLFKQVKSYARHTGGFRTDSNSKTGVTGIQCGPSDLTDTTTVGNQLDNVMPWIIGDNNVEELVMIQCGPDVASTDSLNEHNQWPLIKGNGARRVIRFNDSPNAGSSIPKYHKFFAVNASGANTNVVVDIRAGAYNTFYGLTGVDIITGTTPYSTPRTIKIFDDSGVTGAANDYNKFFGGDIINNTRDIDNQNDTTQFIGLNFDIGNVNFGKQPVIYGIAKQMRDIYAGSINTSGSSISLPSGWSSAALGGNAYRVTHNLGTTNYVVVLNSSNDSGTESHIATKTSTSFDIQGRVVTDGSVGINVQTDFILVRY